MKSLNVSTKAIPRGPPTQLGQFLTNPDWNLNGGGLAFLEHYITCILEGLKLGVPKQKHLDMI